MGTTYNRRRDIHETFGGQRQGCISTPKDYPVVFVITGQDGIQHGYEDGWNDGVFHYYGEGQSGDMEFKGGNKAIRDHAKNNKELLLFEKIRRDGSLRYRGPFYCAGYDLKQAPDPGTPGADRQAIVFHLMPLQDVEGDGQHEAGSDSSIDLNTLRNAAYQAAESDVQVSEGYAKRTAYRRSAAVRDYALARSGGCCENCGKDAPFITEAGKPFLEVHHIHRLTDGGPDSPERVAAICPNCHRAAHHSKDKGEVNRRLGLSIMKKEEGH